MRNVLLHSIRVSERDVKHVGCKSETRHLSTLRHQITVCLVLLRAEYVFRRFDRMCCLHHQGASGIYWGIENVNYVG